MLGRSLWNEGWEFFKAEFGCETSKAQGKDSKLNFKKINIPHDWLIYQGQNLYEDSTGFYRKFFNLDKNNDSRYEVYFEGVYMDTTVYVNGSEVGQWKYGYSSFYFDITNELVDGDNEILVRVDHKSPNSRWYSGAGIYRNVWFTEKPATHFVTDSLYIVTKPQEVTEKSSKPEILHKIFSKISSEKEKKANSFEKQNASNLNKVKWDLMVSAEITGGLAQSSSGLKNFLINLEIKEAGINQTFEAYRTLYTETEEGYQQVRINTTIENPKIWNLENPFLYDIKLTLVRKKTESEWLDIEGNDEGYENYKKSEEIDLINDPENFKKAISGIYKPDELVGRFGLRTIQFDNNKGFFLNGKHVKLNGACEHHDLGALGAAFNKEAMRRKLLVLRDMGVNAIRTAHNMPAVELLELTDEMGFLVVDEAFDMWEWQKTEFDYARFFKEWQERDVRSWIRRDRNHPSVIMWSIGNEIYDTHANEHGQEITRMLMEEARKHDILGNAVIGIGSNYMAWEGAQKCADILKYAGYNYAERLYDEHHEAHPDWYIFGSETSSTLQSRGIYHFPYSQPGLADIDDQCSCLGNCTATWGAKNSEYNITMDRDREYSAGQFIWSGFDYIGEPTPYQTRNSYFGQIDTAGFFKDTAYIYRAVWTDYKEAPFVHITPEYWDFNEGQLIDVRIASNAPFVQLFVNGKAFEKHAINTKTGDKITADYIIPYEKGELKAVALDEDGNEIASDVRKSFGEPVKITAKLNYSKEELTAGTSDLAFIEINTVDKDGNIVANDNMPVKVEVSGAGYLAGLDNGDSTDVEEYKGNCKRLFVGKCLAIVAAGLDEGEIKVSVKPYENNRNIEGTQLSISVVAGEKVDGVSLLKEEIADLSNNADGIVLENNEKLLTSLDKGIWIRKIDLISKNQIGADEDEIAVDAIIYPKDANQKLEWLAVNNSGVASPLAEIARVEKTENGERAFVKAKGDGDFRIRCITRNGMKVAKIISELEVNIDGHGQATIDPYELVRGVMYTRSQGELGNAIEHGIASAEGRSVITFDNLDFGDYGSDEVEVPIFELGGNPCPLEIWEGVPGEEGAEKLYETVYQKPSIWVTYQADTYKLPRRVKGITTISLVFQIKVNVGGFKFTKQEKAFGTLLASDRTAVFGDSFEEIGTSIRNIGNNVSIEYEGMNFGENGANKIVITGKTPKENNTIHILFGDGDEQTRTIIEFPHSDEYVSKSFEFDCIKGEKTVRFIFLPGSQFDLENFRFERS